MGSMPSSGCWPRSRSRRATWPRSWGRSSRSKLLFGLPLLWGCLITAFDTFLLLYLQRWGMRQMEAVILALVATIGGCFLIQIFLAKPDVVGIVSGCGRACRRGRLYIAIGILGATVMPHNLYLHSALVQTRRIGSDARSKSSACRYYLLDAAIALNVAFFVNAAILILSAAVFQQSRRWMLTSIEEAHKLLPSFLGKAAPILFGIALLCAGQSSTLTGTLAGQIVMEGYLSLRMAPWLRRLITRLIALVPAVVVIWLAGEGATQRLIDPQPGDPELAALVRGDSADPLHVEPAEHGRIRHARGGGKCWPGRAAAIIVAPEWQAGAGPDRRMGGRAVGEPGGESARSR